MEHFSVDKTKTFNCSNVEFLQFTVQLVQTS